MNSKLAPQVSVIVPAFNAAATVRRSIESLQRQTLREIEIVVVNDGSTDATSSILAELAASDTRLRVIERTNNEGLVYSLQEGLAASQAPLIARLDADDVAHQTRLEKQVMSFEAPDVVLCATAYRRIQADGRIIRESRAPTTHGAMAAALLDANRICHSSVMFRHDVATALAGYRSNWYPAEDYDLWLRLMEVGRYVGLDEVLVDYVANDQGVSTGNSAAQQERLGARRSEYRLLVIGADSSPTGSPRVAELARRQLRVTLISRGIEPDGVDAQCYSMAVSGPGAAWRRRLRMLAAPTLALHGRKR